MPTDDRSSVDANFDLENYALVNRAEGTCRAVPAFMPEELVQLSAA
jgi:hypothetical protein